MATEKKNERGRQGKVAKVLSPTTLAINRGVEDGVQSNDKYVIYIWGDEVFDPDTKESLGRIQIVKGRGEVISLQEKLCILEGFTFEEEQTGFSSVLLPRFPKKRVARFENVEVGDLVSRINR